MSQIITPEHKIFTDLSQAAEWRETLHKTGRKLAVTTDGSISDIPREEYREAEERVIRELQELGKPFIVLLNSDESVRKLKGPSRPVNTEYDRAYLLASLEFVDAVLIFNDTRCYREIAALQPDCYAKGGDYTVDTLDRDERAALQSAGTEISFIQFVPGLSTSNTIRKMKLV